MASIDFYKYLNDNGSLLNMPPITISKRITDKFVEYNSKRTRMDRIAGNIYNNESCWRIIMWANPQYSIEFDIPDNTAIRIPWPFEDVIQEVIEKIVNNK